MGFNFGGGLTNPIPDDVVIDFAGLSTLGHSGFDQALSFNGGAVRLMDDGSALLLGLPLDMDGWDIKGVDTLKVGGNVEIQNDQTLWFNFDKTIGIRYRIDGDNASFFKGALDLTDVLAAVAISEGNVTIRAQDADASHKSNVRLTPTLITTTIIGSGVTWGVGNADFFSLVLTSDRKIGFHDVTPVAQSDAIPDASGGVVIDAEARTALNALLAYLRTRGDIAP